MISVPLQISAQVSASLVVLEQHLGATLRAIHLYGSSVDGGLKPRSDIDLMVTVSGPMTDDVRAALMRDLLNVSARPESSDELRALEVTVVVERELVPWRYPARREMQFGEWLRNDIDAGIYEPAMTDHDLAILITKLRQKSVCLFGPDAVTLFDPVPISDLRLAFLDTVAQWNSPTDWHGDESPVVLALARIWYSVATGDIASKDVAAHWAVQRLPAEHSIVLERAATAYVGGGQDRLQEQPEQVASFVGFCRAEIEKMLAIDSRIKL